MAQYLEFHGRLTRPEGRAPATGHLDLQLSLHAEVNSDDVSWSEIHRDVLVSATGDFDVLLGRIVPLAPAHFADPPAWVSVRVLRNGRPGEEGAPRVPITGADVTLTHAINDVATRVDNMEANAEAGPAGKQARTRILKLHRRLRRLEAGEGALAPIVTSLAGLQARLFPIDREGGRLDHIEDELEEITGPDGDIIDLLERVEKLEGSGPVPRPAPAASASTTRLDPRSFAQLVERLQVAEKRLEAAEQKLSAVPTVTVESLHAVKRGGDTMTGGLVINRGGLDVLSGGIKSLGAEVHTIDASIHVKSAKVMTEALELRGDLTVDNTKRVIQVRHIEGRAGSGRKDGALELNARSGEVVVIGNADEHAGLTVHGVATADGFAARTGGTAHTFESHGEIAVGDLVVLDDRGKVRRSEIMEDPRVIGVAVSAAMLVVGPTGAGRILVATGGIVSCKANTSRGAIRPGALLACSETSGAAAVAAQPAPGTVLGKAVTGLASGSGEVNVLLTLG